MFGKKEFIIESVSNMNQTYRIEDEIGKGTFATIYRVVNIETKESKACKKLSKRKISNKDKFKEEINILKSIDHPNIIKLHEVFEDRNDYYLIMEECTGGSLFDTIFTKLSGKKQISEKNIALIFKQIMDALNHCHSQGICHRDLKPENILLLNKSDNSPLKLIDFGLGVISLNENIKLIQKVGSPHYVAPEVLNGEYDFKCDIWSAGVILYNLFSGTQPFNGKNENEIFASIQAKRVNFPSENWAKVNADVKDLISSMLCGASTRLSASQVSENKWLNFYTSETKSDEIILNLNIDNLMNYAKAEKFKKAVLIFISTRLKEDEIQNLKEIFTALDINNDGYLTLEELKIGCSKIKTLDFDLEELFENIDTDKSGVINYTEFLAATIQQQVYHKEEKLMQAFSCFDQDKSGKISLNEIVKVIKTEQDEDLELLEDEIKQFDLNGDGEIDYPEFCSMMGKKLTKRKSLKFASLLKDLNN